MKVGIITMVSDNYGNRLQNYALQEVLAEIGNEVETLNNPWEESYKRKVILTAVKKACFFLTRKPARYGRRLRFERFNRRYIVFSRYWLHQETHRKKAAGAYDMFLCGSDQVWNSEAKEIAGKYFADFADRKKRASYAASFGIEGIVPERKEEFSNYLAGMKHISVREQNGVQIVKNLIGEVADCHVDPTLLLSAAQWDQVESGEFLPENRYVFCYFLGKPTKHLLEELEAYKNRSGLDVVAIWKETDSAYNHVGPDHFISLIKNAEFVLTDSFHGTVFSILYLRPFYTFSRNGLKESMDSRVRSLLCLLKLEERFEPAYLAEDRMYSIDFHEAETALRVEREKAIRYLRMVTKEKSSV